MKTKSIESLINRDIKQRKLRVCHSEVQPFRERNLKNFCPYPVQSRLYLDTLVKVVHYHHTRVTWFTRYSKPCPGRGLLHVLK